MSNLFAELQNEAAQQKKIAEGLKTQAEVTTVDVVAAPVAPLEQPKQKANKREPQIETNNGTTAPDVGTTAPHIDTNKLETIISELSGISTRRDGLNVRLSDKEATDVDDFVNDTLRRKGLKGNDVSASKLMRYAFRYILRLHEKEFTEALMRAFRDKEKLSI